MYTYFWRKLFVWPGKFDWFEKTFQNGLFLCAQIWVTWLWKTLDAKPFRQFQWYPLKFDEYDNSWAKFKVGGIKIECTQIRYFLSPYVHQNWSKSDFFRETLCTWIFSTVLVPTKSLRIEHSETYLVCIIIGEPFFGLFWAISELGSSGYIVKLAILIVSVFWVFFAINQIVCQR